MTQLLIAIFFYNGIQAVMADTTTNRWDSDYIDPLYYWHSSGTVWTEFAYARNDWNNQGTDFGDTTKWQNPYAPLSVCSYSSDDGACGYFFPIPPTTDMNCAELGLNDYYLTHDEYGNVAPNLDSDVSLPLNAAWKRQSVSAHELGHCFGLGECSHTQTDCIHLTTGQGRLNRWIYTVQTVDVNDVNTMY